MRADGGGYLEVALDPDTNRTGDVWHVQLSGLKVVGRLSSAKRCWYFLAPRMLCFGWFVFHVVILLDQHVCWINM